MHALASRRDKASYTRKTEQKRKARGKAVILVSCPSYEVVLPNKVNKNSLASLVKQFIELKTKK